MPKRKSDETLNFVAMYYQRNKKYNAIKKKYEALKKQFNEKMGVLFSESTDDSKLKTFTAEIDGELVEIKVTQCTKKTVTFFPDALEKVLKKGAVEKVIEKQYSVNDMKGFIKYLKSIGADPKIFKSFINVEKSVNVGELERMIDLGFISMEDIENCYAVSVSNPYYKIS